MEQLKEEYQLPVYLFHEGKNYEAYRFFGVHKIKKAPTLFACGRPTPWVWLWPVTLTIGPKQPTP